MSTTTNFKRIALVAVAALGLGVLSSVPSQATINADTLTLSSATAAQTTAETYTSTSAVASVSFFGALGDSVSVTAALVSAPAGNTSLPVLRLVETSSATIDTVVATTGAGAATNLSAGGTAINAAVAANTATKVVALSSTTGTSAKYAIYLATSSGSTAAPTTPGTYVVKLTPAAIGVGALVAATAQTLTITVTTAASQDKNMSAANSTAVMVAGGTADAKLHAVDSTVVALKTAGSSNASIVANIYVTELNAAGTAASESITATITGAGTLGSGALNAVTALGRSISVKAGDYIGVFADGNSGVGTITLTGGTSGVLVGTKKVTFSGTTATQFGAATIAATDSSVITATGSTTVYVLPKDADGNLVSGLTGAVDFWAYASDTSVATVGTPAWVSSTYGYAVTVSGKAVGTANISFGNASTLAAATVKSASVAVRVGSGTPSNVTLTTDKATYAPGEKITLTVTILDSTGKAVVGATSYANIFTSTGVTASMNLASGTLPTGTISDYSNVTNTKTYTLYAPVTGGTLTFSATGGTALATANQVAKSVSVTVSDNASAALAAVSALATTVASLKTLIVTLTNLVLKIQKKVKA